MTSSQQLAKGGQSMNSQTLAVLKQFEDLPGSAYVKRPVVQALFGGISDEEVRRRTIDGRIPKPTKLGSRNNIWQVGEALARLQGGVA
jgi:predicted DNA-binding transcriptional regulator AlpA